MVLLVTRGETVTAVLVIAAISYGVALVGLWLEYHFAPLEES